MARPDSNDTRMQQVTYANGKVWGALDTAINPDGGPQRAGIAWYIVKPDAGKLVLQGYLGATGHDFTYPAIGVLERSRDHGLHGYGKFDVSECGVCVHRRERRNRRLERRSGRHGCRGGRRFLRVQAAECAEPDPLALGRLRRGRRSTATRSGSPASTSLRRVTTPHGAGRSSSARPATTCSALVPVGPSGGRETPNTRAREPRSANWSTRISKFTP